jgi:hypothetical protein
LINSGVERVDPTNLSREIMDRILSNPDEFIRIARRIEREPSDPMMQMIMYNSFIRAVQRPVLSGRDDRNYVGEALQGAAGLELQMDQMLNGSGGRQPTIGADRQTQDALEEAEEEQRRQRNSRGSGGIRSEPRGQVPFIEYPPRQNEYLPR